MPGQASWSQIEDGLRTWIITSTHLAEERVIWAEQGGSRPLTGNFCTLRLGGIRQIQVKDELLELTDLTKPAGQEIELRVNGVREFDVTAQFFSGSKTGTLTGQAFAASVMTGVTLPSVAAVFQALGMSCFDIGPIQNITVLNGTTFESRATINAKFYVVDTNSEFAGYIGKVNAQSYMGPPDSGSRDTIDIP